MRIIFCVINRILSWPICSCNLVLIVWICLNHLLMVHLFTITKLELESPSSGLTRYNFTWIEGKVTPLISEHFIWYMYITYVNNLYQSEYIIRYKRSLSMNIDITGALYTQTGNSISNAKMTPWKWDWLSQCKDDAMEMFLTVTLISMVTFWQKILNSYR